MVPASWRYDPACPSSPPSLPTGGLLLVDAAVMALLWLAIRRRFQFQFVPS